MCVNPILIRNRKYKYLSVDTPNMYIQVPCGQCVECLRKRAQDIYVRARYEYDACLKNGGVGFMCCLTYSDDLVPKFRYYNTDYMVFNKKHVIDFIKRLRTNLDRYFRRHYTKDAPDFKYLITSEYGTDPTRSHRPHYHLLFFFRDNISYNAFHRCFKLSAFGYEGKSPLFGKIYQCDIINPSEGGIHYTSKYVCKDLMFESQRKALNEIIKFYKEYVNNLHNINSLPATTEEEFRNSCIRKTKAYRQDVAKFVTPYRHMLQFYMLSNDLGVSYMLDKYGDHVCDMPSVNFEGFPYALPRLVKQRVEKAYGTSKLKKLNKSIFDNYLNRMLSTLVFEKYLSVGAAEDLKLFATHYIQPYSGVLYLVNPLGLDYTNFSDKTLIPWDDLINEFRYFDDSDFLDMRKYLLWSMSVYNDEEHRKFRASIATEKALKEREEYEKKKRNKPANY